MKREVRVGVGVIIRKQGKVLFGLRQGSHGTGQWSLPGGHVEFGETPEQTAQREVMEETGLTITQCHTVASTNDIFTDEDKHYVTLFVLADYQAGDVVTLEPEKCLRWEWFAWDKIPEPRFLPLRHLLEQGYNPFTKT